MDTIINSLFTTTQLMSIATYLLFMWLIFSTVWLYAKALMKDPLLWVICTVIVGIVSDVIVPTSSLTEINKQSAILYTVVIGITIYCITDQLIKYFKGDD